MNLEIIQKYSSLCKGKGMLKHENILTDADIKF